MAVRCSHSRRSVSNVLMAVLPGVMKLSVIARMRVKKSSAVFAHLGLHDSKNHSQDNVGAERLDARDRFAARCQGNMADESNSSQASTGTHSRPPTPSCPVFVGIFFLALTGGAQPVSDDCGGGFLELPRRSRNRNGNGQAAELRRRATDGTERATECDL